MGVARAPYAEQYGPQSGEWALSGHPFRRADPRVERRAEGLAAHRQADRRSERVLVLCQREGTEVPDRAGRRRMGQALVLRKKVACERLPVYNHCRSLETLSLSKDVNNQGGLTDGTYRVGHVVKAVVTKSGYCLAVLHSLAFIAMSSAS